MSNHFFAKRYHLHEKLGEGGMGTVYRATDRLTGKVVALKRVLAPSHDPEFNAPTDYASAGNAELRLALSQEFQTLASLHHPNIITVMDYGFDDQQIPYFTMALLEEASTLLQAAAKQAIEDRVQLIIGVLEALTYLHRRRILHRDLKPNNILVVNQQVKVVDFGLAIGSDDASGVSGTLPYMAPEILKGLPASEASDLYAVGVLLYECIEGHLPFNEASINALIHRILFMKPEFSPSDEPLIHQLGTIAQRLMAKSPEARYPNTQEVIYDLYEALGLEQPPENASMRESFLQAAQFVGREAEFEQIQTALMSTLKRQGSAWLVGGESGVGKSRLLREISTLAQVQGALVWHGQATRDGGLPYQLWIEPLRRLVLISELDDADASILKPIIPDLQQLLGRGVADPVELEPHAAQKRLIGAISTLLYRLEQPLVLILEDLQWTVESLEVLRQISPLAQKLPLLILASYRHDERATLAEELPDMQHMVLRRLSSESIAELSVSMLGEAGQQSQVLDLLMRETEGNVFFLIEVVRALAEEAGHLEKVGIVTLPHRIFSGGMQKVVDYRLNRLPKAAREWLNLAAIIGRQLDMDIMRQLGPSVDWDKWLVMCANFAILELQDGNWRFSHDKLREGVLAGLGADILPNLHQRVAVAIEQAYPDSPAHALLLAHHWQAAGDLAKEIHYSKIAAEQSLRNSAIAQAIRLYQRLLEIVPAEADNADEQGDIYYGLSLAHRMLWQVELSIEAVHKALSLFRQAGNKDQEAVSLNLLASISNTSGQREQGERYLKEAVAVAKSCGNIGETAHALRGLGWQQFLQGNYDAAREQLEESLALARQTQRPDYITNILNDLAGACWGQGDFASCETYMLECVRLNRELGNRLPLANALGNLARLLQSMKNYDMARKYAEEAVKIGHETNNLMGVSLNLNALGTIHYLQGDYLSALRDHLEVVSICDQLAHKGLHLLHSLALLGFTCIALQDIDNAVDYLQRSLALSQEVKQVSGTLLALLGFASVYAEQGSPENAAEILAFVLAHPATTPEFRDIIKDLPQQVRSMLPQANFEAAEARGIARNLDDILATFIKV